MNDSRIRVYALGGLDEVGKDLYCVDIEGDIFIIECGIKLPDKTIPGIDFIIPQFDYLVENKERIKAYIITHGHDLEIGALPYIYSKCPAPLYCTNLTKELIKGFQQFSSMSEIKINYQIVKPTDERIIAGRKVRFFETCHNMAESFGVAISTSLGNIVFIDDFVIDYNNDPGFIHDSRTLAKIGEENNLLLMLESMYADRIGYTAPKYKAFPALQHTIEEAKGRLIFAIPSTDFYNFYNIAKLCVRCNRKLFVYDEECLNLYATIAKSTDCFQIHERHFGHRDDINRYKESDIAIFISGYGPKLFKKLELLATGDNVDRRFKLLENDTVILINAFSYENEISENDAINALCKAVDNVKYFKKNEFLRMHASEEDLRGAISTIRPKYYLPIKGNFKSLLANARVAVNTGLSLNHQNVFVMDNGNVLEITKNGAYITKEELPHGDLYIDGKVFGAHDSIALEERKKLSDDGVILIAATVSRSKKSIVLGPTLQMRGFVYLKDTEAIQREISRIFINAIKIDMNDNEVFNIDRCYNSFIEVCQRHVRRETGKIPLIIPYIALVK